MSEENEVPPEEVQPEVAEPEVEPEVQPEPEPEPEERPPSRAEQRIQALIEERARERERAARAEAQLEALKASQQPIEDLDPDERWRRQANAQLEAQNKAVQKMQLDSANQADRTYFRAMALTNPTVKKYEARVEDEVAKANARGEFPTREAVMKYLMGEDAFKASSQTGKVRKEAQARLAETRGTPVPSRSNVGTRKESSLEEKLQDVLI